MRRALALGIVTAVTACAAGRAWADGLDLAGTTAPAIGRAGVAVVSSDDVGALLVNPAGLARRLTLRAQAGLSLVGHEGSFTTDAAFQGGTRPGSDRGGVSFVPWGGVQVGVGERVTLGAGLLAPTEIVSSWPSPRGVLFDYEPGLPDANVYPHRYAGLALALRRRAIGLGVAARATPWLAIGVTAVAWHVSVSHQRMLWAGLPAADAEVGALSSAFDVRFAAAADGWTPGAAFGIVVAPLDVPVELGASIEWADSADLSGSPELTWSRGRLSENPPVRHALARVERDATAELTLPLPTTFRAGGRFLLSRAVLEVAVEHWRLSSSDRPAWRLAGVELVPYGGDPRAVDTVPLGPALQDGSSLRAALDYDVVPGALAVTAGYAWSTRIVPRTRATPLLGGGASHTFALGVQGRVAGGVVSLGVARRELVETEVASAETGIDVVTPLQPSSIPAAGGRTDGSTTIIALGVELALE